MRSIGTEKEVRFANGFPGSARREERAVRDIETGNSSAIHTGLNQPNLIAVVAQGNAFSLYANKQLMTTVQTKEAFRKKSEGLKLGRPKGRLSKKTKLTGEEEIIQEYLKKKVTYSIIARLLEVHRLTLISFIKSRKLAIEDDGIS